LIHLDAAAESADETADGMNVTTRLPRLAIGLVNACPFVIDIVELKRV
jgi:hypothetical protein